MARTEYSITFRADDFQLLQQLLFPGDGRESVAFALCSTARSADRTRLLVREVIPLPDTAYLERTGDQVAWTTRALIPLLERIEREGLSLLKCHSHPGGSASFSTPDDASDQGLLTSCYQWSPSGIHGSLILSDEDATARIVAESGQFQPVAAVHVVGDRLQSYRPKLVADAVSAPEQRRLIQAFGEGTYRALKRLRIAVIGASGIGSLVCEALQRTGVGELVVVDDDRVEVVNLNRIVHATQRDARNQVHKTSLVGRSARAAGLGMQVKEFPSKLQDPEAIQVVAGCDLIMGCVDNREARHLLCRIAAFYLLPYIDAGVAIRAEANGEIDSIMAGIHYLQPGQSFITRGVFDLEALRADSLKRNDPNHYEEQRQQGYVTGVEVERPAVMPLNMIAAGFAVMELLARAHGYRQDLTDDQRAADTLIAVDLGFIRQQPDLNLCPGLSKYLGHGDTTPLLAMPALSLKEDAA
ncbi:MAG: ThiF family adenylyltransferase [Gammaproteobacteria bacterium]|nr:ThiF family adenylyltransferase [Gammaproteobacteria bacterium]